MARFIGLLTALLLSTLLPAFARAATIAGTVVLVGDARAAKRPDHGGVVVWLEPVGGAPRPTAGAPKPMSMEQRNQTFVPHVLAIEVGTAVEFPNQDPIFHNAFSNYSGQVFDVQLYAPQTSRRVVFRRPGMVQVFCNIHESMSAVIAVLPTPYFVVTGPDGRFAIQAPPGEYRLQVWHERTPPDTLLKAARALTVTAQDMVIPELHLTVSSEPVLPHKNKYGHDYAPRPPEHVFYPGARR
jgi:plastocyanin